MADGEWLSPNGAAKRLGITRQALTKRIFELESLGAAQREGSRWLIRAEDLELSYRQVAPRSKLARAADGVAVDVPPEGDDDRIPPLHVSRAKREHHLAAIAELERRQREGALVEKAAVEREAFECGQRVRDTIMQIVDRAAPLVAVQSDVTDCRNLLMGEVRLVLERLSQGSGPPQRDCGSMG